MRYLLAVGTPHRHILCGPQLREPRRGPEQFGYQSGDRRIPRIPGVGGAQIGDRTRAKDRVSASSHGNTGFRTAAQGAEPVVHLATLPADGPTGQFWGYRWGAEDGAEP